MLFVVHFLSTLLFIVYKEYKIRVTYILISLVPEQMSDARERAKMCAPD